MKKIILVSLMGLIIVAGCGRNTDTPILSDNNISESENIIEDYNDISESENIIIEEDISISENEISEEEIQDDKTLVIDIDISDTIDIKPSDETPEIIIPDEPVSVEVIEPIIPVEEISSDISSISEDWNSTPGVTNSHILLIGDSRLVSLCVYTDIEKKYKVIAQGGADCTFIGTQFPCFIFTGNGYKFNTFSDQLNGTVNLQADLLADEGVDTIVFMLGVNDIFDQMVYGVNGYDAIFKINHALYILKQTNCKIIFNNIGYIRTDTGTPLFDVCTPEVIDGFNDQIYNFDSRINCFSNMPNSTNCDGVHYAPEDQQSILNTLISYIGY